MMGKADDKIELNTSDVINALLHQRQSQQHLATQESVDNLRRETESHISALRGDMTQRFEQVDKRFELADKSLGEFKQETAKRFELADKSLSEFKQETAKHFEQAGKSLSEFKQETAKRSDRLETKFDRLQWFIVAAALGLIFKEQIARLFGA